MNVDDRYSDSLHFRLFSKSGNNRGCNIVAAMLLIFAVFGVGCATQDSPTGFVKGIQRVDLTSDQAETVAVDLVSVLMQLPSTAPFYTTLQFSKPRDSFGEKLIDTSTTSGYGIQIVDADQGANHMSYRLASIDINGKAIEATIAVNKVEVSRKYFFDSERMLPASEIQVRGEAPRQILVSNSSFSSDSQSQLIPSGVVFYDSRGDVAASYSAASETEVGTASRQPSEQKAQLLTIARAAIFTGDRLADEKPWLEQKGDFRPHQHLKIRFKSKDLSLGKHNKKALSKLLMGYDDKLDLLVVTGCSHGKSLLWDGTEADSLSRSQRVKEELLVRGVRRVYEEGCFQSEFGDELLPGMVILTLKKPIVKL